MTKNIYDKAAAIVGADVKKRMGKPGLFTAYEADFLHWLKPTDETADISANVNFDYYASSHDFPGLEKYVKSLKDAGPSRAKKFDKMMDVLRRKSYEGGQWDVAPSFDQVELTELREKFDEEDRLGALYDAGLALARIYESFPPEERDLRDLVQAYEYAAAASKLSNGAAEWVESLKSMIGGIVCSEVHRKIQWSEIPSRETAELADIRINLDNDKTAAYFAAAMARARLYSESPLNQRNPGDLDLARSYIDKASDLSQGNLTWIEDMKSWILSLQAD